jgi:hypothetical protein
MGAVFPCEDVSRDNERQPKRRKDGGLYTDSKENLFKLSFVPISRPLVKSTIMAVVF